MSKSEYWRKWNCHGNGVSNLGLLWDMMSCHGHTCLLYRHTYATCRRNTVLFLVVLQPDLNNALKLGFLCRYLTKHPMNQKEQITARQCGTFRFEAFVSPVLQCRSFSQDESSWMGEHLSTASFKCFHRFSTRFKPVLQLGLWSCSSVWLCARCHSPVGIEIVRSLRGHWRPSFACIYWNSAIIVLKQRLYSLVAGKDHLF